MRIIIQKYRLYFIHVPCDFTEIILVLLHTESIIMTLEDIHIQNIYNLYGKSYVYVYYTIILSALIQYELISFSLWIFHGILHKYIGFSWYSMVKCIWHGSRVQVQVVSHTRPPPEWFEWKQQHKTNHFISYHRRCFGTNIIIRNFIIFYWWSFTSVAKKLYDILWFQELRYHNSLRMLCVCVGSLPRAKSVIDNLEVMWELYSVTVCFRGHQDENGHEKKRRG